MIDKIELRLPPWVDFTPGVSKQLRQHGIGRPGLHYGTILDLRPIGLDAMLHNRKRRGDPTHKLEIFETGKKTYSEIASLIEEVVQYDIERLELMRIDLCADVRDVPVSWFHAHARVRYKQLERRIGKLKSDVISRSSIETVSAGRRPNMIRIYNKVAEWMMQFRKANRKQKPDADPLVFEQEYGIDSNAILTRVERQYGGGRLPREIQTFGEIARAADINPFESIELVSNAALPPRVDDRDLSDWLKGMQLRQEAISRGMHNFQRWLNKHSNGNAARMMKRYSDFMPGEESVKLKLEDLVQIYRDSTVQQLAA